MTTFTVTQNDVIETNSSVEDYISHNLRTNPFITRVSCSPATFLLLAKTTGRDNFFVDETTNEMAIAFPKPVAVVPDRFVDDTKTGNEAADIAAMLRKKFEDATK